MNSSRSCLVVFVVLAVVTFASAAKSSPDKALPTLNGLKGIRQATQPEDNPAVRLTKAIAAARVTPNPAALMNVLYACSSILSALIYNPPNQLIFDQFDAFFYVAELLPQEYQLNYVKRM